MKFTLGEEAVYAVQRCSRELAESVWSAFFYKYLLDVLQNDTWREYTTEAFGRSCQFDDLTAFLTHEDGLCWPSVPEVLQMMQIVADCGEDLPPEKNAPPGPKLQQWAKDALAALADVGVTLLPATASKTQPLAAVDTPGPGRGHKTLDKINPLQGGTSQSYLLRRIARDRPDILERVKSGEFKSARAAAIEAGIIKPVPVASLVEDPSKAAVAILKKMGPEWCQQLVASLTCQLPVAS